MRSTTLAQQAQRAVVFANGARARHAPSRHKTRQAIKTVGLAMIYELRSLGIHVPRKHEQALRGTPQGVKGS